MRLAAGVAPVAVKCIAVEPVNKVKILPVKLLSFICVYLMMLSIVRVVHRRTMR
jgi:hypothetical protein